MPSLSDVSPSLSAPWMASAFPASPASAPEDSREEQAVTAAPAEPSGAAFNPYATIGVVTATAPANESEPVGDWSLPLALVVVGLGLIAGLSRKMLG